MLTQSADLRNSMVKVAQSYNQLPNAEECNQLADDRRCSDLAFCVINFRKYKHMPKPTLYKAIAHNRGISYREAKPLAFVGWVLADTRVFRIALEHNVTSKEIYSLWCRTQGLKKHSDRLRIVRGAIRRAASGMRFMERRAFVERLVAEKKPTPPPRPKAKPLDVDNLNLDDIEPQFRTQVVSYYSRLRDREYEVKRNFQGAAPTELTYYADKRGRVHMHVITDGIDGVFMDTLIGKFIRQGVGSPKDDIKHRLGQAFMDMMRDKVKIRLDLAVAGTLNSWLGIDMAQRMFTSGYGVFNPAGITKLLQRYGRYAAEARTAIAITDNEGKRLIDYAEGRLAAPWMRRILGLMAAGGEDHNGNVPLAFCQIHHMVPFSQGGPTSIANSILLSPSEHARRSNPQLYGDNTRDLETHQPYLVYPDGRKEAMVSMRQRLGILHQIQAELSNDGLKHAAELLKAGAAQRAGTAEEARVFEQMRRYLEMAAQIMKDSAPPNNGASIEGGAA
ncbi:MAG: HNH endonuclease signature motif containing protein [Corynebacterium sp.]|nr:HNH endonuclease signature motif containing protein [Corynebacterium sp.]